MKFEEIGNMEGKTLMLLPGTCCDWQTNFGTVLDKLAEKYHLICVNYDGFDGNDEIFPDMITVTEKIERYIIENHNGRIDGALGSSLGSSFVGQLIQRKNIHMDHGIFGSPDLDQSGKVIAWLQSKLVVPLLTSFTGKVGQACPSGKWCLSENHHYQVRSRVPQPNRDCRSNSKERPCTGANVRPRCRKLFWTFHSDSHENRFPDEWFCQKANCREHDHRIQAWSSQEFRFQRQNDGYTLSGIEKHR